MAITETRGTLTGFNAQSISNNASQNTGTLDLLADDASTGTLTLLVTITSSQTSGSIDFYFASQDVSTGTAVPFSPSRSISLASPFTTAVEFPLGRIDVTRYFYFKAVNNATGAAATLTVKYVLTKLS